MTRRHLIAALLGAAPLLAQSAPKPGSVQKAMKDLPPERRKQMQERMDRLEKMTPQERERLERQYANFQKLFPADQQKVRGALRRFQDLPDDRRSPVRGAWNRLQQMPPEDRKKFLDSPQFRNRFNAQEQGILIDLASSLH
jgi:hypothetical protein